MNIHLYSKINQNPHNYSARKNVSSSGGTIITGQLIDCGGVDKPRFEIMFNQLPETYADINYVYVPQFDRFYFAKVNFEKNNRCVIECESDVLKNLYPKFKGQKFYVEKNVNGSNKYLPDNTLAVPSNYEIRSYNFSEPLINSGSHFILQLMSGGVSI